MNEYIRNEYISESDYLEKRLRGTGRTTKLLKNCRPNALFVVHSHRIAKNIQEMADAIGRSDIEVLWYERVLSNSVFGIKYSEVVFDHFLMMTEKEWDEMYKIKELSNLLNRCV